MLSGDEIGKNNTMRMPAVFILAWMIVLCAAGLVYAEPVMDITTSSSISNYDFDLFHPGDELLIQYEVSNNSDQGDGDNMIDLTLPAGVNQGVYDVVAPTNWTSTINADNTFFEGINTGLAPSEEGLFELYSTDLNIHQDYATATGRGPPLGLQFNPVLVDVPGEFPRTLVADIYFDGIVNFKDFAVLAGEWLDVNYIDANFGNVTDSFSLNASGYDTAGGSSIDDNFFHTDSGIQIRDASGILADTILLPGGADIYGVAHDGTKLFCSNGGSSIYRYISNDLWSAGLGISESGARGLGVSDTDFYLIVDDGTNIARINKTTGATLNKYDITSYTDIDGGLGLDYIPLTNELLVTDGTDQLIRLYLASDLTGIDSWEKITPTGLGANNLYGAGYNLSNGNLVLNDNQDIGKYAEGVIPEPLEADIVKDGVVDANDLKLMSDEWLMMESWYVP